MAWSGEALIPFHGVSAMVDNWKANLADGYQFGDIIKGELGFRNDPAGSSAKASDFANMSEREFADYEMREAHKLGVEADSTKYQRAYKDLVKAGLNPRLLLQSGFDTNGVSASSGYSYSQSDSKSKSNSFSTSAVLAGLILAIAKMAVL